MKNIISYVTKYFTNASNSPKSTQVGLLSVLAIVALSVLLLLLSYYKPDLYDSLNEAIVGLIGVLIVFAGQQFGKQDTLPPKKADDE